MMLPWLLPLQSQNGTMSLMTEAPAVPGFAAGPAPTRDYTALQARAIAAAPAWRIYGQQCSMDGQEAYDLLLVQAPAAVRTPRYHVLLNGGTRGDEPAGAEAVVAFLEGRRYQQWPDVAFTVLPCTNPWGYVHDRREGPGGADLNRSFRRARATTPEVGALKRALRGRRFDLFLDCHEDVDAPGSYVFAPWALGEVIVAAAAMHGPVHPGDLVDGEIPLKQSIVQIDGTGFEERRRTWKTWPLPFYVAVYHQRRRLGGSDGNIGNNVVIADVSQGTGQDGSAGTGNGQLAVLGEPLRYAMATIETPVSLPLSQRVAMHLAAIDAAVKRLVAGDQVT